MFLQQRARKKGRQTGSGSSKASSESSDGNEAFSPTTSSKLLNTKRFKLGITAIILLLIVLSQQGRNTALKVSKNEGIGSHSEMNNVLAGSEELDRGIVAAENIHLASSESLEHDPEVSHGDGLKHGQNEIVNQDRLSTKGTPPSKALERKEVLLKSMEISFNRQVM